MVSVFHLCSVHFRPLPETFDTNSNGGKLFFHILGALAEFEHNLIPDRTLAGLAAARARGRIGDRRPARHLRRTECRKDGLRRRLPIEAIAAQYGVSKRTAFRWLEEDLLT